MRQTILCFAMAILAASDFVASESLASVYSNPAALNEVVLCGQYDNYTSPSGHFTFGTDEWGNDGSGSQCITIAGNGTVFTATWIWGKNPSKVHSFPNIRLNSVLLPLQLSNLFSLNIEASWSMVPSSNSVSTTLSEISASADVVVDMFLDPNPAVATSTTLPKYEIMVWIASFGGKMPIGYNSSIKEPPTFTLNGGTKFTLYMGPNGNGQYVYSWLASSTIENFDEDISPLIAYLWKQKYISESIYLGTVQFGSETFHADANVTFSVQDFSITVASGKPSTACQAFFPSFGFVTFAIIFCLYVSI